MKNQKNLNVRISEDLLAKLAYVSEKEGRTLNNQFLLLARNSVAYFEKTHGKIEQTLANEALLKAESEEQKA